MQADACCFLRQIIFLSTNLSDDLAVMLYSAKLKTFPDPSAMEN